MNQTKTNLSSVIPLLTKEGFTYNEKDSEEMVLDKIKDFLKSSYEGTYEKVSEKRKKGHDLLIPELQLRNAIAKQQIALATLETHDIQAYFAQLKKIQSNIPQTNDDTDEE